MRRAGFRRPAVAAVVALLALTLVSPMVRAEVRPATAPFSEVTAVHAALRSALPAIRRDSLSRASRLAPSRAGHGHGPIPVGVLATLALLAGLGGRSLTIAGHRWRSLLPARHSIWRRGPPKLT